MEHVWSTVTRCDRLRVVNATGLGHTRHVQYELYKHLHWHVPRRAVCFCVCALCVCAVNRWDLIAAQMLTKETVRKIPYVNAKIKSKLVALYLYHLCCPSHHLPNLIIYFLSGGSCCWGFCCGRKIHSDKPCGKGENRSDRHTGSRVRTWDSNPSTLLRSHSRRANGPDSVRERRGVEREDKEE